MKHTLPAIKTFSTALGLAALTSPAFAVIPFPLETNSSGTIIGGSWSGNGTVQPNVTPGNSTTGTGNAPKILVDNFGGTGALTINNMGGNVFSTGRLVQNPTSAIHTISLNSGGTADLRLHNSNNNDGGALLHNSVGLTGFNNVTSFSYTISFSAPIAGRDAQLGNGSTTVDYVRMPVGSGLAMAPGTGLNLSSYYVNLTYATPQFTNNPFNGFSNLPSSANAFKVTQLDSISGSNVNFEANSFPTGGSGFSDFLLIRGWDTVNTSGVVGTDSLLTSADVQRTYITSMTWTVQRDDGLAFPSDAIFVTSMDGQQYTSSIPEPTAMLLSAAGLIGGCLIRRRRA
jgi:hypothetical protein